VAGAGQRKANIIGPNRSSGRNNASLEQTSDRYRTHGAVDTTAMLGGTSAAMVDADDGRDEWWMCPRFIGPLGARLMAAASAVVGQTFRRRTC
jgi:hypothetical protein